MLFSEFTFFFHFTGTGPAPAISVFKRSVFMDLVEISRELSRTIGALRFQKPVSCVYNPLSYAREPYETYLTRFGSGSKEILLVGMNPGPWGMAQTGVPFGEIHSVKDWMKITGHVGTPECIHEKRPVHGFECGRSEASGKRLWGWAADTFTSPEKFFSRFFVINYCPLIFYDENGKNLTPDKLPNGMVERLHQACDKALREDIETLSPRHVVGVGKFAEGRIQKALGNMAEQYKIGRITHPSPANPRANRGWAEIVNREFREMGIALP